MQTKLFLSKFSPERHALYVCGMTGELSGPVVSVSPHLAAGAHLRIRQHCRKPIRQTPQTILQVSLWLTVQRWSHSDWIRLTHCSIEALSGLCLSSQSQLFISIPLPLPSLATLAGRAGGPSSSVWAFLKRFGKPYWEGSLNLLAVMALPLQENDKSYLPQSQRKVTKWPRHKSSNSVWVLLLAQPGARNNCCVPKHSQSCNSLSIN